mmetsp:Transcript_49882/g.108450  ORF Transcript_49882/g.108450 Transcript_49882/m.108450 type:complete len:495 (+) Transcript_49882:271-1755(+)
MYFACLAPVVAFGQLTGVLTENALGVPHFLAAAALSGVGYAAFSGQPMTMIGPTGLTFAYVGALFRLCKFYGWPFASMYAWTGLWCSGFLALLACGGACRLVGLVTRFTDDVFNGLIVLTFLATACSNIALPFAVAGADKTVAFVDASIALGTFGLAFVLSKMRSTPYLWRKARNLLSDFGPTLAIGIATLVARSPAMTKIASVNGLAVPASFELGRSLLVPLLPSQGIPAFVPLVALPPAILLTLLFFLDQNITSRVVNNPMNGLKKGATYHFDMLVLSVIVAISSLIGLPWMVAATVQSLAHVRAMTGTDDDKPAKTGTSAQSVETGAEPLVAGTATSDVAPVIETRLTGTMVHGLIGCSVLLLPLLRLIPASAISGLFLYLGTRMMAGNAFLARIPLLFRDYSLEPVGVLKLAPPRTVNIFTLLQVACLALLWILRAAPSTGLLFPSMILMLVWTRVVLAPRIFSKSDLEVLDEPVMGLDGPKAASAAKSQ